MMKKKICLVAHLNDLSGANKSLIDLATNLKEIYDITVVVPRKGLLADVLIKEDVNICIIKSATWVYKKDESNFKKFVKKWGNLIAERRFYNYFKKNKFDLVHFNSSVYGCGAASALKLNIPYTWHIRELAEENFSLTFFNRKNSYELINSSQKIITISNFMKEKLKSVIDVNKIEVVYNGVEISPLQHEIDNIKEFSLVIVGAVAEDKGQMEASRALEYLHKNFNIAINLVIIGPITDNFYATQLKSEITESIRDYIVFEGYKQDLSEYRRCNNISLVCSRAEAFGRVTIEAMNCGQLVIGANAGATPEIIIDNKSGFLYESGNFKDLATKIKSVLEFKEKHKIIEAAHNRLEECFDIKNTAMNVATIFNAVLKNN